MYVCTFYRTLDTGTYVYVEFGDSTRIVGGVMGRIADRAWMANRWNANGFATSMTLTGRRGAARLYRLLTSIICER